MNGEIPSVPITTLAGIASLTDLLPEMPLPSPLPQTLSNKSLLFHPRVAEEAQILLSVRDDALVPQLIQSLVQTSADHIELKDHYAGAEPPVEQQQNIPELLKAILHRNPNVFKGPQANSPRQAQWGQQQAATHTAFNSTFSQASPASYGQPSPSTSGYASFPSDPSPSGSRHTPQGSPAPPAAARFPAPTELQNSPAHYLGSPYSSTATPAAKFATSFGGPSSSQSNFHSTTGVIQAAAAAVCAFPPLPNSAAACSTSSAVPHQQLTVNRPKCPTADSESSHMRMSVITEQNRTLLESSLVKNGNDVFNNGSLNQLARMSSNSANLQFNSQQCNLKQEAKVESIANSSTALSSLAGPSVFNSTMSPTLRSSSLPATSSGMPSERQVSVTPASSSQSSALTSPVVKQEAKPATDKIKLREPRVMLNRLKPEDEALMQKSLKAFAEKSPSLASKLGIVENHRSGRLAKTPKYRDDPSSDSDEEPKRRSKFFKNKGKEKEIQRKKEKEERRSRPADDDDEYVPPESEETTSLRGRKRNRSLGVDSETKEEDGAPKKKNRKLERKLVPVIQKLSTEELMETNTYQRFNRYVEMIFDNTEDLDLNAELDEDADAPPEALIPKYQLQDLCSEAAKLKVLGATESIPPERLVRLLNILEKNIRDGARVSPIADPDDDEEESKLWLELTMERVMRAVDSSLAALYILTSNNMPKRVYLEDVIDRIVLFTKYQLQNTIYPSFDPVYRIDSKNKEKYVNIGGGGRKKRAHSKEVREKSILMLYNKLNEVVNLLAELLSIQILTDTAVLHVSTLGVAPFFVESVSELQLSSLKLVTTIFTRYEKHRRLLLDDILASIARLPSTKRSLRSYRLSSEEYIQMLTALVLQLIQCVVSLPERLHQSAAPEANQDKNADNNEKDKKPTTAVDRDVMIVSKYEIAMQLAGNFLTVFLNKCGSKNEEIDYRPLFENFVQDLLTTVNKPEWPAAELLLSLLGKILVKNFMNKGTEMSLRVASLDYLGVVAARLRKDAVTSQLKVDTIDQIIKEIQDEEQREAEEAGHTIDHKKKKKEKANMSTMEEEEERTQFLQRVLLDYLAVTGQGDQGYLYARHFYVVQWFKDAANEVSRPAKDAKRSPHKANKKAKRGGRRGRKKGSETEEESSEEEEEIDDEDEKPAKEDPANSEVFRLVDKRKNFLMTKIKPLDDSGTGRAQVLQTYIEYESAELISRYLASKRPFSHSFDVYLIQILSVLNENSIAIRTKAMKCLTMVVEADPAVLGRTDMQMGVKHSFLDHSTSVREAAVDLVGKFVLSRPDLIDKYYDMLSQRILDTGVSVRKRVIKILKDICIECPEFTKIPEICVKMIRRVNDEEGIRKLVMEVFQNMWFTPVRERPTLDKPALLRKVMNITDVVSKCRDIGLDWFEQLLVSLFKPKEDKDDSTKVQVAPPKSLLTACKQIVDCLIENVLRLEETYFTGSQDSSSQSQQSESSEEPKSSSQRLVACLTTLYLLAKIRPQLLVDHAITLQPYLSLKCKTPGDFQIISCVARTLELVVPLIEHPSESFMAQLEEDSVKLILQHERSVVASCLSCLGSVVNNVTRNFKLIRDCFKNYYGTLTSYKQLHQKDANDPRLLQYRAYFRRALFTVGLLMRHFDFNSKEVNEGLPDDIKNQVFETLMYFVNQPNYDVQYYTLQAIGSLCIRHYDFMLGPELKELYHLILTDDNVQVPMRIQVLNNIEIYLQEEERRMIKQDQEWAKLSKKENLKEMGDISSGMASTVIQLYLREVLEAFLHPNVGVRKSALRVIQLILQQGLVHPVQIVPYLICMSTDVEQIVSHSADKQLQEIEKKYPGFIHMKTQDGIWLSYKLQQILQETTIVRGFRTKEGEMPTALNGFLYSILRNTKQQRRAITLSILKQFDEQVKTSLSQMMYLADNLAYFPYQVQDEPLFIIHHIDIVLSMCGTNLLQSFREALQVPGLRQETAEGEVTGTIFDEEEEEDVDTLVTRIPEDTLPLQECITASQGCMLLLVLKQHLKDLYGITDAKLTQYSPSESAKVYEKALSRRSNSNFDPKLTIQKLKEGALPKVLDEAAKRDIIAQYLNFKQLMLNFDPKDPDDEDENAQQQTPQKARAHPVATEATASSSSQPAVEPIQAPAVPPPPKIPKLTIVAPRPPPDSKHHKSHKSHKSDRHRKHKHKKKRKKAKASDEEEEEESDYSDPDFLV